MDPQTIFNSIQGVSCCVQGVQPLWPPPTNTALVKGTLQTIVHCRYRVIALELVAGTRSITVLFVRRLSDAVLLAVTAQGHVDTLGAVLTLERRVGRARYNTVCKPTVDSKLRSPPRGAAFRRTLPNTVHCRRLTSYWYRLVANFFEM